MGEVIIGLLIAIGSIGFAIYMVIEDDLRRHPK